MFSSLKQRYKKSKLTNQEFAFLFEDDTDEEYISVDCETTGLNTKKDEILSIGAVKIVKNKIELGSSFERFVTPGNNISQESIKIHHIRPCDMQNSIDPKIAIEELLHFIGNRTLVGYYIQFDIAMINRYAKDIIGTTLPNKSIELSNMYLQRYKKKSIHEEVDLKFDTIMNHLDLPRLGQHDALNDAVMSAMIYLKLKDVPIYRGSFN